MLDKAVDDLLRRTQERSAGGKPAFSLSKMIRGLRALHGEPINPQSAEDDVKYLRALTTGATPGSYLVPNIQAEEIVAYLSIGGILRASGARIWPMNGIQKMTVPTALGAANLTAVNCAGSANGGNISYSDIITLLPQMADVKGVGPFCWYMSPRTFFQRVLGLIDTTSRPLTIPTLAEGLFGAPQYRLMGWPVFVTPFLPRERVARLRHEPGTRHFHQPEVPSRRPGRKHRDRLQPGAIF